MKNLRSALIGTVLLSAVIITGAPAMADDLTTHQWYNELFFGDGSLVVPGGAAMVNGPLAGGGTGDTINPPATPFTIAMTQPGYLVATDGFVTGDQFQVFVNGVAATPTTNNLTPSGQSGLTGGFTSVPTCLNCEPPATNNISVVLANAHWSSGTFFLPVGLDTITITAVRSPFGNGAMAFYADVAPVPAKAFSFTSDHCSGGCGTSPFGTVTVTQVGPDVRLAVALASGVSWAQTGAADFQLLKFNGGGFTGSSIQQTFAGETLALQSGTFDGDGTGNFSFGIACITCKNGALGINSDIIFTLNDTTVAAVTQGNNFGNLFVADILGTNGTPGR